MQLAILFLLPIIFTFPAVALADDYCVAVRGNGEYAAGHWGGMAKLIEAKGLPRTMMGGSSASISIFLMNGIAQNPSLAARPEGQKRKRAALLVKSLPAFFQRMGERDGILGIYGAMLGAQAKLNFEKDFLGSLKTISFEAYQAMEAAQQNPGNGAENSRHFIAKYLPLLNPELRTGLANPATFEVAKKRLQESAAVFGAYRVDGDPHMFFRSGILDFRYLALIIGTVADFYSGAGGAEVNGKLEHFLSNCEESMAGREWLGGECGAKFEAAADSYLAGKSGIENFPNRVIFENVGEAQGLEAFISTATMHGASLSRFKALRQSYRKFEEQSLGADHANFSVNYENDLRFSYIGKRESLEAIAAGLKRNFPSDEKSEKFHSLGDLLWLSAIAASAGEPGLTNFQPLVKLPSNNPELARNLVLSELRKSPNERWGALQRDSEARVYNLGGWSDLHPTLALRSAASCENKEIVYLNRVGGETCFGQMLFVRVTGAQKQVPFWRDLCVKGNSYDWRNDPGFALAKKSAWHRLYHNSNPVGSYQRSVHEANTILCTDWDKLLSPFTGREGASIWEHFNHAYRSPLVTRGERATEQETRPGCSSSLDRL